MFTINKCLLAGLVLIAGEIFTISSSKAEDSPPMNHDSGTISVTQDQVVNTEAANSNNGNGQGNTDVNLETGKLRIGSSELTISPEVIQAINNLSRVSGNNSSNSNGDGAISGDANSLSADSSDNVTICLSDPCVPSGESTRAITLNELAELMEQDLQNSLTELAAAEAAEQRASKQPRRFVRRRATNCNCANSTVQAREIVKTKLEQSQKFVEQIEQLSPENSMW